MHPASPTAFGSDEPRVYLDRLSGSWRYEDEEGEEWEWQSFLQHARPAVDLGETEDEAPTPSGSSTGPPRSATQPSGHWVKVLDDDLVRAQQAAYSVEGVDEAQPAQAVLRRSKKRPASPSSSSAQASSSSSSKLQMLPPSKKPKPVTSLYVTGLPLDATSDEIARVFSRYGVLLEDDQGKPRVKMYYDDKTAMFKGEALVVYFKPESVELAISMLDETSMRAAIGQSSSSGPIMRVQRAEFPASNDNHKNALNGASKASQKSTDGNSINDDAGGKVNTETVGQRRNLTDQDRKKIAKRVARLETKLSDWRDDSDSDPESTPTAVPPFTRPSRPSSASTSAGRVVVLTKMFTLFELESDPTLLLDLKEDVREECTHKIGGVTNVILWDKEPEGIITVKFQNAAQARECVTMMKGRFFAQRRIDAFTVSGKPRFKRSSNFQDEAADSDDADDNPDDTEKRRDAFGTWLEHA